MLIRLLRETEHELYLLKKILNAGVSTCTQDCCRTRFLLNIMIIEFEVSFAE